MSAVGRDSAFALFGTEGQISVTRGVAEFHGGRPVLITAREETLLALPVESLDQERLAAFVALCVPAMPRLIVTARRAVALGLHATSPVAIDVGNVDAETILAIVAGAKTDRAIDVKPAGSAAIVAIQLAKLSQGLPAVLVATIAPNTAIHCEHRIVNVDAASVTRFGAEAIRSLTLASKASVPLVSGSRATFVVFHDGMGGSPAAIIVGKPDLTKPILVRLHSACLTGDVFGSQRCDCGDQLKLAMNHLEQAGGGIVLYLPQEGRGLGLANKMRTYQMQDDGLDTIDANTTLGFDEDERDYGIAARMLQMLECSRVVLLTNNPAKLAGLAKAGIEIAGRVPLEAPINGHNRRYLTAKASRAGHRLEHILASASKSSGAERM